MLAEFGWIEGTFSLRYNYFFFYLEWLFHGSKGLAEEEHILANKYIHGYIYTHAFISASKLTRVKLGMTNAARGFHKLSSTKMGVGNCWKLCLRLGL